MLWSKLGIFEKILKLARKYYFRKHKHREWFDFDSLSKKAPFGKFSGKNPTNLKIACSIQLFKMSGILG
jgi:hypothetical protein